MSRDERVAPERERTFTMSLWQKVIAFGGALAPIVLALAISSVFLAPRESPFRLQELLVPLLAALMAAMGVRGVRGRLRVPRSTIRVSPSGLTVAPDKGGAEIAWSQVRGAVRRDWQLVTELTDAQGGVLAGVDDRLESAHDCLDLVADAAWLDRPQLPARYGLRGIPTGFALLAVVVGVSLLLYSFGSVLLLPLVIGLVMIAVFAFVATLEVVALELDESGLTIRRPLGEKRFGWDEISHCGFRLVSMRDSRWVEATIETRSGSFKLVPMGVSPLPIVAAIREHLRRATPAT
ncbi:MAG: PH domain-containing protein [Candidatus Eisenbacteria bacterium]|nr:PH domain-containing protein [Candidatus Eisenbacteria bacterium]